MKLLVILMATLVISPSFARGPFETQASQFLDTISVSKTSVDMRVRKRGWITNGSVTPDLNLVSQNVISFEYQFNPFSKHGVEAIFSDLEKESLLTCREMGKEQFEQITSVYRRDRYKTILNLEYKIKFKELDELSDGLSAYLETKCILELRLREKR
jgi:hypothetical protein